jgi:hypothetical protein
VNDTVVGGETRRADGVASKHVNNSIEEKGRRYGTKSNRRRKGRHDTGVG